MQISNKFKQLTGASVLSLAAIFSTGCATSSGIYSEGSDYNGQRTRIQNQPTDCTITMQRGGTYNGGRTTQVGNGSWSERCVSSPYGSQRQRGTNVVQQEYDRAKAGIARDIGNEVRGAIRDAIRGLDL